MPDDGGGPPEAAVGGGSALLSVSQLQTRFRGEHGFLTAVDDVSFDIDAGEIFSIVGESGSGKSVTALSVMGLIGHRGGEIAHGSIRFDGVELVGTGDHAWRRLRGNEMSMVFQDPMTSLNPLHTIGDQIAEVLTIHTRMTGKAAHDAAIDMLAQVGIPNPKQRANDYPHQFSGGMRQRAMIAMAMVGEPRLLIADEPTTALDVTIQAQILELLASIRESRGTAIMLITHDLGVVAGFSDRVMVMYGGRMHERGRIDDVFYRPYGPYTWGLLDTIPRLDGQPGADLTPISGAPPSIAEPLPGCRFAPRCSHVRSVCHTQPPPAVNVAGTHEVSCHFAGELDWTGRRASTATQVAVAGVRSEEQTTARPDVLLSVQGLARHIPVKGGAVLDRVVGHVKAVDGVSFDVYRGETLGLVGESGCGKSTTARLVMGLLQPSSGSVNYEGTNVYSMSRRELRTYRSKVQMVYQDPYASLNPRLTIADIVAEPMRVHKIGNPAKRTARVLELLDVVGLDPSHARRYPHEFSGGQRQRIGIARALTLDPELLILDEPVSALDVSIQAQILNLLLDLQREFGLTYLVIAHDLAVVRHMSDRVAVMYLGRIVEYGLRDQIYDAPSHPYTQALLSAIPIPDPRTEGERQRVVLQGDPPSPLDPPAGCAFHPRCWKARPECATRPPMLEHHFGADATASACHYAATEIDLFEVAEPAGSDA